MTGTRVTATDLDTDESESIDVRNSYVLICDGSCYQANVQAYANGTHVITVKGIRAATPEEPT